MSELVRVAMVILHRDGRVLMQLRDSDDRVYASGRWGIFGGHVEEGETPEEAARREIEEELGVSLGGPLELFVRRIDEGRERFIYKAPLDVPLSDLTLREGQGMALLSREQVRGLPVVPVHVEVLAQFFDGLPSR
jgi:8-oxo-dGTP diphosphatase